MTWLHRLRLAVARWLLPLDCTVVTVAALNDFEVRVGERDDPAWDDDLVVPFGWDHI